MGTVIFRITEFVILDSRGFKFKF